MFRNFQEWLNELLISLSSDVMKYKYVDEHQLEVLESWGEHIFPIKWLLPDKLNSGWVICRCDEHQIHFRKKIFGLF